MSGQDFDLYYFHLHASILTPQNDVLLDFQQIVKKYVLRRSVKSCVLFLMPKCHLTCQQDCGRNYEQRLNRQRSHFEYVTFRLAPQFAGVLVQLLRGLAQGIVSWKKWRLVWISSRTIHGSLGNSYKQGITHARPGSTQSSHPSTSGKRKRVTFRCGCGSAATTDTSFGSLAPEPGNSQHMLVSLWRILKFGSWSPRSILMNVQPKCCHCCCYSCILASFAKVFFLPISNAARYSSIVTCSGNRR